MSVYIKQLIEQKKPVRLMAEPDFSVIAIITEASPLGIAMTVESSDLNHYPVGRKLFFSINQNFSFYEA